MERLKQNIDRTWVKCILQAHLKRLKIHRCVYTYKWIYVSDWAPDGSSGGEEIQCDIFYHNLESCMANAWVKSPGLTDDHGNRYRLSFKVFTIGPADDGQIVFRKYWKSYYDICPGYSSFFHAFRKG